MLFAEMPVGDWAVIIGAVFIGLAELYKLYLAQINRKAMAVVTEKVVKVEQKVADVAIQAHTATDAAVTAAQAAVIAAETSAEAHEKIIKSINGISGDKDATTKQG